MGMFDWVDFKVPCPKCGREVKNFQSKDGDCLLDTLDFWQVDNFYSYCHNCEAMINYTLRDDIRKKIREMIDNIRKTLTIKDYDLEFRDAEALATMTSKKLAGVGTKEEGEEDTGVEEMDIQSCDRICDNCDKL